MITHQTSSYQTDIVADYWFRQTTQRHLVSGVCAVYILYVPESTKTHPFLSDSAHHSLDHMFYSYVFASTITFLVLFLSLLLALVTQKYWHIIS